MDFFFSTEIKVMKRFSLEREWENQNFITKYVGQLLQIATSISNLLYYKVRHGLLQIATTITKCDKFIRN